MPEGDKHKALRDHHITHSATVRITYVRLKRVTAIWAKMYVVFVRYPETRRHTINTTTPMLADHTRATGYMSNR
jgi:hypothetical protein